MRCTFMFSLFAISLSACQPTNSIKDSEISDLQSPPIELEIDGSSNLTLELDKSVNAEYSVLGGNVEQCEVDPPLPNGLEVGEFNNGCRIFGNPTNTIPTTSFELTAAIGQTTADKTVDITVFENVQPPSLSGVSEAIFTQYTSVEVDFVNDSKHGIDSCITSRELPIGLSLNTYDNKCTIAGIPETAGDFQFQVIAINGGGQSSLATTLHILSKSWLGHGPDPSTFDAVGKIQENQFNENEPVFVFDDNEASELSFTTQGFPNYIKSIELDDGNILTKMEDIKDLFGLHLDPIESTVKITVNREFDYENHSQFYAIKMVLGQRDISTLVRLYDLQDGTPVEPIKIDNYEELLSLSEGELKSHSNHFENILSPKNHQTGGLHFMLRNDIDASNSLIQPWSRMNFAGHIDGHGHVITDLNMPDGLFSAVDLFTLANIGFVDLKAQSSDNIISLSTQKRGSQIHHVFFTGVNQIELKLNTNYAPISDQSGSLMVDKVYVNILTKALGGNGYYGFGKPTVSGLIQSGASDIGKRQRNVYVNGSLHTEQGPVSLTVGCLTATSFTGFLGDREDELFYCSQDYRVTTHTDSPRRKQSMDVSMVQHHSFPYQYPNYADLSAAKWRFVINRNLNPVLRTVANGWRDSNNDGHPNDLDPTSPYYQRSRCSSFTEGQVNCFDGTVYGLTELAFKEDQSWSGLWKSNEQWTIEEGQWPVLTNMPYPHAEGELWMKSDDPGAEYQRHTYDDYLDIELE